MKKRYYLIGSEEDESTPRIYMTYGVCQKNNAEHIGGHAMDGCQAFWPLGEEGTPNAVICVACYCHRSFHQVEVHTKPLKNKGPPPPPPPAAAEEANQE